MLEQGSASQIDQVRRFNRTVTERVGVLHDHYLGLGLGRRFLAELEARAAGHGFDVLRLDTNRTLGPAIGLYLSYGFQEVAAFNDELYAHHWFEKRITTASSA